MKKLIGLLTIAGLALAVAPALANSWTGTGNNDYIVTQVRSSSRSFIVDHNAAADIDNTLIITSNSGENVRAAGGDIEGGSILTGDADIDASETSDVNSLEVLDECCDVSGSSDANTGIATDDNDFILTQAAEDQSEWYVETDTYVNDNTYTELDGNTGRNAEAAGEDMSNGDGGISTGDSDVIFDRMLFRNFVSVKRVKSTN